MSEIDAYRHECIGIVTCPSDFEIVAGNDAHRSIPLYRLDEDAPSWGAKKGDLLLGGGSGESAVLRVSIPEAIGFFTREGGRRSVSEWDAFRAYWSANQAYVFCSGYAKMGWTPAERIETWLAEHVLAFLLRERAAEYGPLFGTLPLQRDGSLCGPAPPGGW